MKTHPCLVGSYMERVINSIADPDQGRSGNFTHFHNLNTPCIREITTFRILDSKKGRFPEICHFD